MHRPHDVGPRLNPIAVHAQPACGQQPARAPLAAAVAARRPHALLALTVLGLAACAGTPPSSPAPAPQSMPAPAAKKTPPPLGTAAPAPAPVVPAPATPAPGPAAASAPAATAAAGVRPGFFITSRNPGQGADFGGLEGADRHCQALATAAGYGSRTWHAYLSASDTGRQPGVNARDRIGEGPWYNVKGERIALDVEQLHEHNNLTKLTALNERGETISGRGDPVNAHDILTGSSPAGRALQADPDSTCSNWTSSDQGSAIVGHHDRQGLREDEPSRSWNASHRTRGCSLEALRATGGAGLLYCFAID